MNIFQIARNLGSLQRLRRILAVLTHHGFGHMVERWNLARFVPLRRRKARSPMPATIGQRLAKVCTELGPTFVKLGQFATTRPDLLPADVIEPLRALQDRVPPFDSAEAVKIIEQQTGSPLKATFASFEHTSIASGSIGQVHLAVLHDGTPVIVKIKRPDIEPTIHRDLHLVKALAELTERLAPELKPFRLEELASEFEQTLLRELDYTFEAVTTERIRNGLADHAMVQIPAVCWPLTGPNVLVEERVPGKNIDARLAAEDNQAGDSADPIDRAALANRLAECYLAQFFEIGVFHADPHPGNLLVSPPSRLAIVDFGQIGIVSKALADRMLGLVAGAIYGEIELIVAILTDLEAIGPDTDTRRLANDIRMLMSKYVGLPAKRTDPVRIFHEASTIMREQGVVIPRELVLVLKTLCTVMGTVTRLDPDFDWAALFRPRLRQLIFDRLSPDRFLRAAGMAGWHTVSLLTEAPQHVRSFLRRLAKGNWSLDHNLPQVDRLTDEMDRSSNRVAFALVIASVIIASSVVISVNPEIELLGIKLQWLGVLGFLVAGVLGIGLLWAIFRSGRLS